MMKRPSIKTALVTCLGVMAALVALTGFFSLREMSTTNRSVTELATNWLPTIVGVKDLESGLSELRSAYQDHILAIDDTTEKEATNNIEAQTKRVEAALERYGSLATKPDERPALEEIRSLIAEYQKVGRDVVKLSTAGLDGQAKRKLHHMQEFADKAAVAIDRIVAAKVAGSGVVYEQSAVSFRRAFWMAAVLVMLGVGLAAIMMAFAVRGIANPIERITRSMLALAAGDSATAIPFARRSDEIGKMALAVETFRQNAIQNIELQSQSEGHRVANEQQRLRGEELERSRAAVMASSTTEIAAALKQLSAGDVAFRLEQPFHQDFENLRLDFNSAAQQLQDTLQTVARSAQQIGTGSSEITRAVDHLSRRTEKQAASLEETAAALDQITSNVSAASLRARQAQAMAGSANEIATRSSVVVSDALEAMQRIEDSSRQVTSIIDVMDQIAFQTNLLALNAGVEAARAGDAGKGFAVVAHEVRELAQRSAEAGRDIAELIRNSSTEVEFGVKLVRETGAVLREIQRQIAEMNNEMAAICASAQEQASGLQEVNSAVTAMDQVTQQNAAMVEETHAASANLVVEAERLAQLVARFDVGGAQPTARKALVTGDPHVGSNVMEFRAKTGQ
jgi:methyl-accepting chemotaxis protein